MERMADTVVARGNALEREMELKLLRAAQERDSKAEAAEKAKKAAARQRDIDIRKTLDHQLAEKKTALENEREGNKKFIKMVLDQDDSYNKLQREKAEATRKKAKELLAFQRVQAGEFIVEPATDNASSKYAPSTNAGAVGWKRARSKGLGGPMNQEEIRMNKGLLKEISKMKKQNAAESMGTSPGKSSPGKNESIY